MITVLINISDGHGRFILNDTVILRRGDHRNTLRLGQLHVHILPPCVGSRSVRTLWLIKINLPGKGCCERGTEVVVVDKALIIVAHSARGEASGIVFVH